MENVFFVLGLVMLILCLVSLAIIKVLETRLKKKELREERESFDTPEPSKPGHIGYVESKYALIHKESSKIIISASKSKVMDTLKKMYDLELTSVSVSDVVGLTPFGGHTENMVLLSYKLDREGLYTLIQLNKEEK
ncbi:membrane protein [Staphylococcus phage CF7]|nr:membrane protein [Staphylococcus phage CF7]